VNKLKVKGGMSITCKEVVSLEGESSVVLRQGKKRYVFDYELKVSFDVLSTESGDVVGTGEWTCNDFNSEAEGECDMTISMKKGKEQLKTWLKTKSVEKMVNDLWLNFCKEFRSQH
jgi:activator of HSP90 ATPase